MSEDEAKGSLKETEGKVRKKVGDWTGDAEQQVKGVGQQVEGKVQKSVGKAERKADEHMDEEEEA